MQFLLVAIGDGSMHLYSPFVGPAALCVASAGDGVSSLALHENGRRLLSADVSGTVRLWSIEGGEGRAGVHPTLRR